MACIAPGAANAGPVILAVLRTTVCGIGPRGGAALVVRALLGESRSQ